jgi:hypothetical protein
MMKMEQEPRTYLSARAIESGVVPHPGGAAGTSGDGTR